MRSNKLHKIPETYNLTIGIKLTPTQEKIVMMMVRVITYFFKGKVSSNNKIFRGFLLVGPPGSGKTEIAKIASEYIKSQVGGDIEFKFVDSANIAAPHWGEAERNLSDLFRSEGRKKIILLDDVECLFLKRGFSAAKEWHYSINSLLLHSLDKLEPSKTVVIATTNRPDLIDAALRSRLYEINVPIPPRNELITIARNLLESLGLSEYHKKLILENILKNMEKIKNPSIRDIQHLIVKFCIESGVWT